jgi:hypothetical protein
LVLRESQETTDLMGFPSAERQIRNRFQGTGAFVHANQVAERHSGSAAGVIEQLTATISELLGHPPRGFRT